MGVRQHHLDAALAGAGAERAAVLEGFERACDLIVVAGRRIEEPVDAAGHVREEHIGADQADDAQAPMMPTRMIGSPARKNWPNHTTDTTKVMPKSGCIISSPTTIR